MGMMNNCVHRVKIHPEPVAGGCKTFGDIGRRRLLGFSGTEVACPFSRNFSDVTLPG